MRWLADECVAAPLVKMLREADHDVVYVAETAAGLSDADVIALAHRERRLLLTEDKDFGDLIFRWKRAVPGLVLIRIDSEQPRPQERADDCSDPALRRRAFRPLSRDRGGTLTFATIVE